MSKVWIVTGSFRAEVFASKRGAADFVLGISQASLERRRRGMHGQTYGGHRRLKDDLSGFLEADALIGITVSVGEGDELSITRKELRP